VRLATARCHAEPVEACGVGLSPIAPAAPLRQAQGDNARLAQSVKAPFIACPEPAEEAFAVVSCYFSNVRDLFAAVSCYFFTVRCVPATVSCHFFTVRCVPATVSCYFFTVRCVPATVTCGFVGVRCFPAAATGNFFGVGCVFLRTKIGISTLRYLKVDFIIG
jgi:hypothetical protein